MADYTYTPKETTSLMALIDTYKRWDHFKRNKERRYKYYHPSEWGKAQPLDSLIQTPYGPKKMGDIKEGDKICSPDGAIVEVLELLPQGIKNVYSIKFADRDEVECCGDHLWEVDSLYMGFASFKILATKELKEKYISEGGNRIYSIRLPRPLNIFSSAPFLIHPYFMGVILGDGCLRCNSLDITSKDKEIVDRIATYLNEDYEMRSWRDGVQHRVCLKNKEGRNKTNIYKDELRKYGLMGKRYGEKGVKSNDRFIPDEYLYVKERDRWSIIHGLMDTDGYIDKRGYASFSTSSYKLSQQFKWLIESVGGICCIKEKETTHLLSYLCYIKYKDTKKLFFLKRKRERGKERQNIPKRIISEIKLVGQKEVQCIRVSHPNGLYLTDHCVITHNCLRTQQYKHYVELGLLKVEYKPMDSKILRLFDKGHNMHGRWANYFDDIGGILRGRWKCKNISCFMFDDDGKLKKDLTSKKTSKIFADGKSRVYGKGEESGIFKPSICKCGCKNFEYLELSVIDEDLNIKGHADLIIDCSNLSIDRFKGVRHKLYFYHQQIF